MRWPWNPVCTECERLKMLLTRMELRLTQLETERLAWVAEAAKIVDSLTSIEHRQRMREARARNGGSHTDGTDLLDVKGGRMGWKSRG